MDRLNVCCLALLLLAAVAWTPQGARLAQAASEADQDQSSTQAEPAAQEPQNSPAAASPLPIFISLRSNKVNLRSGPGVQYPIDWVYQRRDLPVQLIDQFETWRRVRDWQGTVGWVHQSMVHGKRTVMVTAPDIVLRREPNSGAAGLARLEEKVIASLKACKTGWCEIEVKGMSGWLPNDAIFGLNAGERRN